MLPAAPALRRGPGNPDGIAPEVFGRARQAMRDDAGAAIPADCLTKDFLGPGHAVSALLERALTRRQLVDLPLPGPAGHLRHQRRSRPARRPGRRSTSPTLVIQGDADKNNPLELTGRRAAGLIPQRQARHPRRRGSRPLPERGTTVHDRDNQVRPRTPGYPRPHGVGERSLVRVTEIVTYVEMTDPSQLNPGTAVPGLALTDRRRAPAAGIRHPGQDRRTLRLAQLPPHPGGMAGVVRRAPGPHLLAADPGR